jgi:hypothetical protein
MENFQKYDPTATVEFECDPLRYAETWRKRPEKITLSPWYSEREKAYFDCEIAPCRFSHTKRFIFDKLAIRAFVRERDPNRGYDVVIGSGRDFSVAELKHVRMAKKQVLRRIAGVCYSKYRAAISKPRIESLLTFRGREEVSSFLRENPFLVTLILQARTEIRKQFPDSQLFLELLSDTEGTDPDRLYLYISTDLAPIEARPRLKALDNDWWLAALNRAQNKLCISLEYQ